MNEFDRQPNERRVVIVVEPQRWRSLAHASRATSGSRSRLPWAALLIVGLLSLPALGGSASTEALAVEAPVPDVAPTTTHALLADAGQAPAPAFPTTFGAHVADAIDDPARPPLDLEPEPIDVYELPPVIEGAVMVELPPVIAGAVVIESWPTGSIALTALETGLDATGRTNDCLDEAADDKVFGGKAFDSGLGKGREETE